jgi:hypothetical protein
MVSEDSQSLKIMMNPSRTSRISASIHCPLKRRTNDARSRHDASDCTSRIVPTLDGGNLEASLLVDEPATQLPGSPVFCTASLRN